MNINNNKIESKDNEKIKTLKKLQDKKYRNKSGLFCVENFTIIVDALRDGKKFQSLFLTENFFKKNEEKLKNILIEDDWKKTFLISDHLNKSFSSLDTPSGICAVYEKMEGKADFDRSTVYFNGVSDPGNLGTILRSALAFGFENVVLDENCADLYNPKTVQASKGVIFNLNISFDKNLEVLKEIKNKMKIISTDVEKGIDSKGFKIDENFCLVLGNETRGVDERVREMSDIFLNIKISSKIESLNVSSSAAILFYELGN